MKKIVLLIFLITNSIYCQKESSKKIISFDYNDSVYKKIAKDSIKVLYDRQKNYYTQNKSEINKTFYDKAISLRYRFEDLDYFIIPQYRLYRKAEKEYSCKSSIENYIAFNEPSKYLKALIRKNNVFIGSCNIPNFIFEYQRIYTPDVFTTNLRSQYVSNYLNDFSVYSMSNYNMVNERKNNFFFELYGLDDVIFEIENKTGLLYANYFGMFIDEVKVPRMLANEFIRKYVGEGIIIELAKGNYKDIDAIGSIIEFKACQEMNYNMEDIILKVVK